MRLDLTAEEAEMLEALLGAALRERMHQIHHSHARDYRRRLEREAELIEGLSARLAGKTDAA